MTAPDPVESLARLKTIVDHVGNQWGAVLYRQAMTRSTELGEALSPF